MEKLESIGIGFNSTIKEYRALVMGFLRSKAFVVSLIITIALGYGFTLTNFSYGVDDTSFGRYFNGTDFIATGRFTAFFIHKVFGIYEFVPFWQDFLAVIMLFCSALFWCVLIKRAVGDSVGIAAYVAFAAVFISFPNINEIFIYMMAGFSIGLGFLLTGISLAVCYEIFFNKLSWKWLALPSVLMCLTVSLYESFAPVYLCGMIMLVILRVLFVDAEKKTFKFYLLVLLKFCGVLLAGIIMRYAFAQLILSIYHVEPSTYKAVQILWGEGNSLTADLIKVLVRVGNAYIAHAGDYLYTLLFSVSCVILIQAGTCLAVKKRDYKIILLFLGLITVTFMLMFIQGRPTPFRANQSHMVLVAFTIWILCAYAKKWRRPLILFISAWLVLIQTKDLSQWFYNDYMRYQQEKSIIISISAEIEKLDDELPVVFTGTREIYLPNIKHNQTNGMSIINWGMGAFKTDTEIFEFFKIHGFTLMQGNSEQKAMAQELAKSMPAWPKEGSIKEYDDFIIVNFGNTTGELVR